MIESGGLILIGEARAKYKTFLFLLHPNKKRRRPGEICHVCNYDEQGDR